MQFTLISKPSDDPHDVVAVPPDAVGVAPADQELANLLHQAARYRSEPQARATSGSPASGSAAGPAVPTVDTTFRPASVNDVRVPGKRWSMVRRAARGFTALLLAACIGGAAFAWRSYGDTFEKKIVKWATQFVMTASLPPEKPGTAAQPALPAVQAEEANAAAAPPAAPAQTAAEAVAPAAAAQSPDPAQMQSMARDLASVGQEVEQLKASIEQLKASQQQMSRDIAKASETKASETKVSETKASEQNARPKISAVSAPPPRPAAARPRRPVPPYPPPQAAAAPALPQAQAPYVPRQPDYAPRQIEPQPQVAAEPPDEELSPVPRPPMPVR